MFEQRYEGGNDANLADSWRKHFLDTGNNKSKSLKDVPGVFEEQQEISLATRKYVRLFTKEGVGGDKDRSSGGSIQGALQALSEPRLFL